MLNFPTVEFLPFGPDWARVAKIRFSENKDLLDDNGLPRRQKVRNSTVENLGGASMSDRSVAAETIRSSAVVTGDGNIIIATFGDTGIRLPLQRRQVRAPDRRRAPRPGELPRELDVFSPDTDA